MKDLLAIIIGLVILGFSLFALSVYSNDIIALFAIAFVLIPVGLGTVTIGCARMVGVK